jgi:hypothetical protein
MKALYIKESTEEAGDIKRRFIEISYLIYFSGTLKRKAFICRNCCDESEECEALGCGHEFCLVNYYQIFNN